jgi:hypothetical protein
MQQQMIHHALKSVLPGVEIFAPDSAEDCHDR